METDSLALLDVLPVLVWRSGRDVRCDYFNQAWLEFTGRRLDQEVGDGWTEGVHPDDRERCVKDYLEAFEARKPFVLEYRLRHSDGEYRWIRDVGRPWFAASGEFSGYIGGCIDVTDREKAVEALRKVRASTESVLDSVTDTYILLDRNWRYVYVNEAAVRAIGRPREQILGCTLWDIYPDIAGTELDRQYRRAMDERVSVACDFHYLTLDTWWENRLFPAPEGLAVFATDITERRAAEERIRGSEDRLRAFMDNSPSLMFIKDLQGRYLHINEQFTRSFGLDRRNVLLRTAAEIFPPDLAATLEAIDARVLAVGAPIETEETVNLKDGAHTHLVCKFPITDTGGKIIALGGIRTDITERERAESEIRTSREQLRSLASRLNAVREEERASIALNIHDELGQALTSVKIDLSLLEQAVKSRKGRPSSAHTLRELRSAKRTIDKALDAIRRIAAELRPAVLNEVGLTAAIEWLAKDFEKRARIKCKAVLSSRFPEPGKERSTALYRILQEALTNVARHAAAKTVEIELKEDEGKYVLQVRDDGVGIPDHRLNDWRSLGLNGMRERTLMLGGQTVIERKPGGTVVTASIPRDAKPSTAA